MKILLNNVEHEINVPSIGTILDVVMKIESTFENGHIITTIKLNDKFLNSDWYHNAKNIYVLDDDKLEITTESSNIVAIETLKNLKKQHRALIKDLDNIADKFRMESEEDANKHFVQGIENLQWFFRIIENTLKMMNKNMTDYRVEDKTIESLINDISKKLEEVIAIQQDKNWVLLADFIEYEIIPLLEKFKSFLNQF